MHSCPPLTLITRKVSCMAGKSERGWLSNPDNCFTATDLRALAPICSSIQSLPVSSSRRSRPRAAEPPAEPPAEPRPVHRSWPMAVNWCKRSASTAPPRYTAAAKGFSTLHRRPVRPAMQSRPPQCNTMCMCGVQVSGCQLAACACEHMTSVLFLKCRQLKRSNTASTDAPKAVLGLHRPRFLAEHIGALDTLWTCPLER